MLTRTLRNLESTGLITRRVTRAKAIAVEYSLTRLGRTIITPLRGMCRWARRHGRGVSADVYLPQAYETQRAKAGCQLFLTKNDPRKGEQYEHYKQGSLDHRGQPRYRSGTRQRGPSTGREEGLCGSAQRVSTRRQTRDAADAG